MPHAETEVSWDEQDSFTEPSLKRLRPDCSDLHTSRNPAVSTKRKEKTYWPHSRYFCLSREKKHETIADEKSTAETEHSIHNPEKGSPHSKGTSGVDYNGTRGALFIPLEPSDEDDCNIQPPSERPDFDRSPNKSTANIVLEKSSPFIGPVFQPATKAEQGSETRNAFIGPLFRPALKAGQVVETSPAFIEPPCLKTGLWTENPSNVERNCTKSQSPHFKISTVKLRKAPGHAGAQNGMDYELRQFYKELHILEAETDDIKESECKAEGNQEFTLSNQSSQDSNTFLEHAGTPYNKAIFDGQSHTRELYPYNIHRNNCFLNNAVPPPSLQNQHPLRFPNQEAPLFQNWQPPRFQNPLPPTLPISHGRPPLPPPPPFPLYNHPVPHPMPNAFAPSTENESICFGHNEHQRQDQQHWHSLPNPHNARTSNINKGNVPFLDGECGNRPQEHHIGNAFRNQESHSGTAHLLKDSYVPQEQHTGDKKASINYERKLILLRGLPGSGKTTLARLLLNLNPDGLVFSTDDFFCQKDGYSYNVKLLGDAHNWNQFRARRAMDDRRSPVIIDNTNMQGWEMKPYVQMAIEHGYFVDFLEPETWWKLDPLELAKRNTHGVPHEKISQMLERYEHNMTVPVVMNSVEPPHKNTHRHPQQPRPRWEASEDFSHRNRAFYNRL
ncbi:NEDD4-binding protein 2-like 2 [Xenopus laevis]|uniref:NEDD4-binding protein 2-like 2 n=2 Tax=Xenopus laevis TaxID=8355 RepID=A0A1L8HAL0_XENLA|nr:NEDD4-binding protein 2-like 2 [Xenopus laevis]XP_041440435.1 NEDD4-binding protein 2-like 2 [Xenopus laevis]OCT93105.1 hypothetical protein XELAEV_18016173mg [Xenopus laevis]